MASTPEAPSPDEEERAPASDRAGDYDVGDVLRQGWGGTLHDALFRPSGGRFTAEEVRPDLIAGADDVARLADLGRAASAVRDPHVVSVHDLVEESGRLLLVAEWTDDPTLAERLRRGWPGTPEALTLTTGVLAGLEALHAAGLFHGAVGAETVLAGPGGARLAEVAVCAVAAPPDGGPEADVKDAARLGLRLLRGGGSAEAALRRPLEAALVETTTAAALRARLDAAAEAVLGPEWRSSGSAAALPPPSRRLRRRLLIAGVLVAAAVVAGIVAGALLASRHVSPPLAAKLAISPGAKIAVKPAAGGCDTTFDFVASGAVTGTGVLVYRWEQSDGEATANTSLTIRPEDGAFQLTEAWRLQGSQTVAGAMTLHILRPVDRRLRATFRYTCP